MWAFPSFEGARSEKDVREALSEMGIKAGKGQKLPDAEHVFTHRVWKMKGWRFDAEALPEGDGFRAVDGRGLREIALPTAFRVYRAAADEMLSAKSGEEQEK
jgi:adenine-specific DNA glycosylase